MGTDNRKRWSKWDIVLAQAFQILENERCSQCGLPRYICGNDSRDIDFRIEKQVCYATIAREKYEKAEEKKRGKAKGSRMRPLQARRSTRRPTCTPVQTCRPFVTPTTRQSGNAARRCRPPRH